MGFPRSQAAMSGVMGQLLLPLLLLLLLTTALNVAAQTAAASDCTQYVADLSSCQNYLTNAATVPGTDCCSGIATVEKDSVSCLCAIVSQLVGAASGVNLTRVYAVPKDCNLTFNNSSCSAAGISPTASTPTTSGASPSPVGVVAAAPSKNGGAKSIIIPSFYTVFGAVVLGCVPSMVFSVVAGFGVITAV